MKNQRIGVIERYQEFLPVTQKTLKLIVSLNEGSTPLILSEALTRELGIRGRIYYKFEGQNPTGSFKDRGMTLAVTKVVEEGGRTIICASTGNTAASAAAFAARANLACLVVIPEKKIAKGKLLQSFRHGAKVIQIRGNFDEALRLVQEICAKYPIHLVNSLNPYRIEGQKTAAFEICDVLGDAPHYQVLPVGNAGNITAYWQGYKEYFEAGKITHKPKILGFQAAGAAPIVKGKPIDNPQTIATAICIGNPASWKKAEAARDESRGLIESVTDEEIMVAYRFLAEREGIFCEAASAATVAGVVKLTKRGYFAKAKNIILVLTLTGHGLKDPDLATSFADDIIVVDPEVKSVLGAMKLKG